MKRSSILGSVLVLGTLSVLGLPQSASAGGRLGLPLEQSGLNEIRLTASAGTVAYYSNGKFKAVYRERVRNDELEQKFKFEVEGFTPNAEVPVLLNGVLVATAIVNPLGRGEFQFASVDNNPGGEMPLPGGFPRLRAGDSITIGTLTTTFH